MNAQAASPSSASRPRATGGVAELFRGLDSDHRFHRDRSLGRIFHPGTISYREAVAENGLHIVIDGDRVSVHIDRFSPLGLEAGGSGRYSLLRVVAHNLWGMAGDVVRFLGGKPGDGRCDPSCDWVEVDGDLVDRITEGAGEDALTVGDLLDRLRREVSAGAAEGVRHVPFNVVDQVVDLLDSDDEPWSVQLEVGVGGTVDEGRLRTALRAALRRHPMATARRLASSPMRNRDYWELTREPDVDPFQVVDCPDDAALERARARLQSLRVPLAQSPPLRLWLARHPDGDVVMLNAHHAATDGFGALRLLRSVAREYTAEPDPQPEVDFLSDRGLAWRLADSDPSTRLRRYLALGERLRDLLVPPARIARDESREQAGYGIHHERLGTQATDALVDLDHRGSVNDVLLAALHLAVASWNAAHARPCRRVSVLVPANLRPAAHHDEIVGNFSLPARVSTTARQRTDPAATLAAVTAQTSRKKRSGMGTALLEVLMRTWLLPLWAKKAMVNLLPVVNNRFVDTAVLSNLGSVRDVPSFDADADADADADGTVGLWFSAPARMPLGLSVGAVTAAGRLHLAFRYRHPQFGPDAARRFAACYLAELGRVVDAVSGRRAGGAPPGPESPVGR